MNAVDPGDAASNAKTIMNKLTEGWNAAGQWLRQQLAPISGKLSELGHTLVRAVSRVLSFLFKALLFALGVYFSLVLTYYGYRLGLWVCKQYSQRLEESRRKLAERASVAKVLREHREEMQRQIEMENAREDARREQVRRNMEARKRAEEAERTWREQAQQRRREEAYKAQQSLEDTHRKYQDWRKRFLAFFEEPESYSAIPEPPAWPCNESGCLSNERKLKACRHSLGRLFSASMNLKEERHAWHPDRPWFRKLESEGVQGTLDKAKEVFQAIDIIWKSRGKESV